MDVNLAYWTSNDDLSILELCFYVYLVIYYALQSCSMTVYQGLTLPSTKSEKIVQLVEMFGINLLILPGLGSKNSYQFHINHT